jgi:hypothetical protein
MASDPAYITAFDDYIASIPGPGHREEWRTNSMEKVITRAAFCKPVGTELILERAVQSRLRGQGEGILFGPNGPLGTFFQQDRVRLFAWSL